MGWRDAVAEKYAETSAGSWRDKVEAKYGGETGVADESIERKKDPPTTFGAGVRLPIKSSDVVSPKQAQEDVLKEIPRQVREFGGALTRYGAMAKAGLTEIGPAFIGTMAEGTQERETLRETMDRDSGLVDRALAAGADASKPMQENIAAQSAVLQADPSLLMRTMEPVISLLMAKGEAATGNSGFFTAAADFAGALAMTVPTSKLMSAGGTVVKKTLATPSVEAVARGITKKIKPVSARIERSVMNFAKPLGKKVRKPHEIKAYGENGYQSGKYIVDKLDDGAFEFLDGDGFTITTRDPATVLEMSSANTNALHSVGAELGKTTYGSMSTNIVDFLSKQVQALSKNKLATSTKDGMAMIRRVQDELALIVKSGKNRTMTELQELISTHNKVRYGAPGANDSVNVIASKFLAEQLQSLQTKIIAGLGDDVLPIKRQYAAHAAIRDGLDANHSRMLGLPEYSDLSVWGGGAIHQLMAGRIVSAVTAKGVDLWNKMARNPNTPVKIFFKDVRKRNALERGMPKQPPAAVPTPEATAPAVPPPVPIVRTPTGASGPTNASGYGSTSPLETYFYPAADAKTFKGKRTL